MLTTRELLWVIVVLLCLLLGPLGWAVLAILALAWCLQWIWQGVRKWWRI